jgi:hypothetical protein
MSNAQEIGDLQNSIISAVAYAGFAVTTADGRPATLAVIDQDGNVIESGASVNIAAWNVAVTAYRNFLKGNGHVRVQASPPGITA